jgi:hypothetical protein
MNTGGNMQAEDKDQMFIGRTVSVAIAAVVPNAQLMSQGSFLRIECSHPQIGECVCIWLTLAAEQPGPAHGWVLSINAGDGAPTPVFTNLESGAAITSFIWADRMLCTRFAELQRLLNTGVIPRCVSDCGDLHNFLDWNMAGEAEELLEAGGKIRLDAAAGPMDWPCSILNAVDGVIGCWLARHAETSLAADATASHMAGLLCSHNAALEQQVAERFLQMQHDEARDFLHHAAGHDGSNLTMKVMALVRAAARVRQ